MNDEAAIANVPDAVLTQAQTTGVMPVHWWTSDQCWRMMAKLAGQFANSTLVPQCYRNEPGNVVVALAAGMPLGLSPLACLQSVAVINGKPSLYGEAPIAQVLAHPSLQGIDEEPTGSVEKGDRVWSLTITRKMASGVQRQVTRTFSVQDAKRAGLWGKTGPWSSYPDRMLYNRARAMAVRDSFADVLQGVVIAADATDDVVTTAPAMPERKPMPSDMRMINQNAQIDTATLGDTPPDATKPKPKPKRKANAKAKDVPPVQAMANDAAARLPADAPSNETSGAVFVSAKHGKEHVVGYAERRDEPHAWHCSYDVHDHQLYLCNADSMWRIVNETETALYEHCYELACDALRKTVVSGLMSRRMSSDDAAQHIKHTLQLDHVTKVHDLTLTQLADLANDMH